MHEIRIGSKLSEMLSNNVNLTSPNTSIITRRGDMIRVGEKDNISVSDVVQLTIAGINGGKNWIFTEETTIPIWEDEYKLNFNSALNLLVKRIIEFGDKGKVRFNLPYVPNRGVMKCNLEIIDDLIIRYVEDYIPTSDALAYRFDVLINKEI